MPPDQLTVPGHGGLARVRAVLSVALLAVTAGACGSDAPAGPAPDDPVVPGPAGLSVLFIGSSYFAFNDLPGIFERLAIAADKPIFVKRDIVSGNYLDYFADNPVTEQVIQERDWDYVVLQGGCQNAAYPETHDAITPGSGFHAVYPALETLKTKIEANQSGSRTVYMMPWAFEDGMTWVEGQTDTYADMQLRIYDNAIRWADALDLTLAPVGWAWYQVLSAGPPVHYLHDSDWNHPSLRGSYLSTGVIYSTVFVESVENVPYDAGLDPSEAADLRRVARPASSWTLSSYGTSHRGPAPRVRLHPPSEATAASNEADAQPASGSGIPAEPGGRAPTVQAAHSYSASNGPRVHFGLGSADRIEEVVVFWLN